MSRDKTIDVAKGFAIILMVVGHCDDLPRVLFRFIFSFHMPLFFLFSGYFFKEKDTASVALNGLKTLVKPYVVTTLVCAFFLLCFSMYDAVERRLIGSFVGCVGSGVALIEFSKLQAGPIWFLLALFWCKLFFNWIFKLSSKYFLQISLFCGVLFWLIGRYVINVPLCVCAGGSALIFYSIGYALKLRGLDRISHRLFICFIWGGAIMLSYLNMAQYIYSFFPISIFGAVAGCLSVYYGARRVKGRIADSLIFVGRHTLIILCCHTFAFTSRRPFWDLFFGGEMSLLEKNTSLLLLTVVYSIACIAISTLLKRGWKHG